MTFPLHSSGPFTGGVTKILASFANFVRTSLNQALDGAAGGAYTPTSALVIGGEGIRPGGSTRANGSPATATIDVSEKTWAYGDATAGSTIVLTLRHSTAPIPNEGERIRVSVKSTDGSTTVDFRREDATSLGGISSNQSNGWAEFVWLAEGKWVVDAWGGSYSSPVTF